MRAASTCTTTDRGGRPPSAYLAWHRSPLVPLAKLPLYVVGSAVAEDAGEAALAVVLTFATVELGAGVARRQWNDLHDRAEDAERGARWTPAFGSSHSGLIRAVVAGRTVVAAALAALLAGPALALAVAALLALQWLYDHRPGGSGAVAVALVAAAYPIRALAPALALERTEAVALLVGASVALAGAVQVLDWRRAESELLLREDLRPKRDTDVFAGRRRSWTLPAMAAVVAVATIVAVDPPPDGTAILLAAFAGLVVCASGLGAAAVWGRPLSVQCVALAAALGALPLLGAPAAATVYALTGGVLLTLSSRVRAADYFGGPSEPSPRGG